MPLHNIDIIMRVQASTISGGSISSIDRFLHCQRYHYISAKRSFEGGIRGRDKRVYFLAQLIICSHLVHLSYEVKPQIQYKEPTYTYQRRIIQY